MKNHKIVPLLIVIIMLLWPSVQLRVAPSTIVLATRSFSLDERQLDKTVNEVFKDNILLTLAYMNGQDQTEIVDWNKIRQSKSFTLTLPAGKTFAFHEDILPKYQGQVVKTTNAHFNFVERFKSDGYLTGDGVCHLASLIYWVARDAGLEAYAPTNHDFATIPQVPKEFGVSIYNLPGEQVTNANQNLYITNNLSKSVTFKFDYDGQNLKVTIILGFESLVAHKTLA